MVNEKNEYWKLRANGTGKPWNKGLTKEDPRVLKYAKCKKLGMTGKKHSQETKLKMSKWQIGKKLSEETKKKIGLGNTGKIHSEECRLKISLANKLKKMEVVIIT